MGSRGSARGSELRRVTLTATTSHPARGDEIEVEKRIFIVNRVVHRAEGTQWRTIREYSFVPFHVRPPVARVWWRAAARAR